MVPVSLPRLALVVSLAVLGVSLAGFVSAAGLAGGLSTATAGEVAVDDGVVVFADAGGDRRPVADATAARRVEITDTGGLLAVTTRPKEPGALTDSQREAAARIAVSDATLAEQLETSDGVTVDVEPLRADEPVDRQLRRSDIGAGPPAGAGNSTFRSVDTPGPSIALERVGPRYDDRRALVVVEPVDAPDEYRAVVDLDAETVDRILQLEVVN